MGDVVQALVVELMTVYRLEKWMRQLSRGAGVWAVTVEGRSVMGGIGVT